MLTNFIVKFCYANGHTFKHISQRTIKRACKSRIVLYFFSKSSDKHIMNLHVYHTIFIIEFRKMASRKAIRI